MEEARANPDALLKKIQEDAATAKEGHLKIFFGYAAGVGKTYTMLKAAHAAKKQGIEVVVGYVEPHARPETQALLRGLPQLHTLSVEHSGVITQELDLDAALHHHPQLVVVDELAHTNGDGCRHAKRYQDVSELLKAGIDVYTTVNVQHIESLNDIVASITGVMVRERIPDKVFDNAEQVELVDIEPDELMERLRAGKVYREKQAEKALGNFFTPENLVALREIALRRCADRVNLISQKARQAQGSQYHTEEHILVCLSPSPSNAKTIRTAARLASAFKGNNTALFVETPAFAHMREEDKNRLRANIRLAQQLGANIETVYGDDVPFQIAEFARLAGVSKVVLGRSNIRRKHFLDKLTLAEKLSIAAPNLDIYIIPDAEAARYKPTKTKPAAFSLNWGDVLKSLMLLVLATAIGSIFNLLGFSEANIITVYILGVLATAVLTGHRIYSLVSSVISVLTFNFFFTDPRYSLEAYDTGYPITFLVMFLAAFLTGSLAVRIQQNAHHAAQTAHRTSILLETNQLLQKAPNKAEVAAITAGQLTRLLGKDVVFYLVDNGHLGEPAVFPYGPASAETATYITENEKAVAAWVFQNNNHAGATTSTLGSAKCLYLALRVNKTVYGVLGVALKDEPIETFEYSIVLSMLGEAALALENQQVLQEREEASVLAKNEQLRANLLRSISHDLRTPLTAISGNAGILLASEEAIGREKRKALYADIYDDSLWLINLVENLLSVTRIEDGTMQLNLGAELMEEVMDEALRHLSRQSSEHTIRVQQPEEFILAKMDARLIVQVLINLIDNAVKYTQTGSEITVSVRRHNGFAVVDISDNGKGISDEAKPKIFDMFYTASTTIADSRRSLGLGLALCKSIVTAHGGTISVRDNQPTGTVFTFTLPLEEVTLHE